METPLSAEVSAAECSSIFRTSASKTVSYAGVDAEPFDVTLHAPNAAQKAELAKLADDLREAGTWGQWILIPPPEPHPVSASVSPADPLRFNRALYYLYQTTGTLTAAPLHQLTGLYAPEALLVEAEVALTRNDKKNFEALAAKIRKLYPDLVYLLDGFDHDGSMLVATRRDYAILRESLQ